MVSSYLLLFFEIFNKVYFIFLKTIFIKLAIFTTFSSITTINVNFSTASCRNRIRANLSTIINDKGGKEMKINCHIDPNLDEEHGELWIKEMTPKINDFLQVMS